VPNFKLASNEEYKKFTQKTKRVRLTSDSKISKVLDKLAKSEQFEFHYRFFNETINYNNKERKLISLYDGKGKKILCFFKTNDDIKDEREIRVISLNHYFMSLPDSKMKAKHGYAIN
jgi:hypothetical protein